MTGSWDVAARICKVGEITLRRRCDEWVRAGIFGALASEALEGYDRVIGLDLSEVAVDGSQHKAPSGGEGTGKNPTDRGKLGWKWSQSMPVLQPMGRSRSRGGPMLTAAREPLRGPAAQTTRERRRRPEQ